MADEPAGQPAKRDRTKGAGKRIHNRYPVEIQARRRALVAKLLLTTTFNYKDIAGAVQKVLNDEYPRKAGEAPITVDVHDVFRDRKWQKRQNLVTYRGKYKAPDELIEAIELLIYLEKEVLQLYNERKLNGIAGTANASKPPEPAHRLDRLLRTAREFRRDRLLLMVDFGLMDLAEAEREAAAAHVGTGDESRAILERLRQGVKPIKTPYMERWLGDHGDTKAG